MSRIADVGLLHPACGERVGDLLTLMQREGLESLQPYETARSPWRQAELYARGRTSGKKKVTKARAWESNHQYGLALDSVFLVNGVWTWDEPEAGMWDLYHACARRCDLAPLSFEKPHVELAWNLGALRKGHLPGGYEGSRFHQLLDDWEERWGSYPRVEAGQMHPGAPAILDLDDRPPLDAA